MEELAGEHGRPVRVGPAGRVPGRLRALPVGLAAAAPAPARAGGWAPVSA